MPRVAAEKSERLDRRLDDISVDVEDCKADAVGQHPAGPARRQRRGQHVVVGADFEDGLRWLRVRSALRHGGWPAARASNARSYRHSITDRLSGYSELLRICFNFDRVRADQAVVNTLELRDHDLGGKPLFELAPALGARDRIDLLHRGDQSVGLTGEKSGDSGPDHFGHSAA